MQVHDHAREAESSGLVAAKERIGEWQRRQAGDMKMRRLRMIYEAENRTLAYSNLFRTPAEPVNFQSRQRQCPVGYRSHKLIHGFGAAVK